MAFKSELEFERELISLLTASCGWSPDVIKNPTEEDLIENWKRILFEHNNTKESLNGCPLTDSEMRRILEQINKLRTPLKLHEFINDENITIIRDNPKDTAHAGKSISLKIFDRNAIAGGWNCYQIAEQPKFETRSPLASDRRGDFTLLINGMPLIHVELKRSGVHVSEACGQIKKYTHEGVFGQGIFSLVQIFAAMNPEEFLYFANPGEASKFNPDYYFHWADFNNVQINDWKKIAREFLSIPKAHEMVGLYMVADDGDKALKVMRSYQYYAARAISDRVEKIKWNELDNMPRREITKLGGYVWHTTGSGKTLTSFKSAQLIANSKHADKVVFLVDRKELGTQSLGEYRGFADDAETVNSTENTDVLISKLKSDNADDTLIVTSIQKMSRIKEDTLCCGNDMAKINSKRIVAIVDECHRSTSGDMLQDIKITFPRIILFGFTGTPISKENAKVGDMTTADIFGDELCRYSIAHGINDKNVLGFDKYMVPTYDESEMKKMVALRKADAQTVNEANENPRKKKIFNEYIALPMAGYYNEQGDYVRGIEDYIPESQFERDEHKESVVENILKHWDMLSLGSKFHALLATKNIPEALDYYNRFKAAKPDFKVFVQVDPSIDNEDGAAYREDALIQVLEDYNARYGQNYTMSKYDSFKKDVAHRLAHKHLYKGIEKIPEKQIDLLIVVNQMLTGYDSKWINTLYLDKVLKYENLIQAFSRTNRLFGDDKPYGTIKYYRRVHTMERNIDAAFKMYSGDEAYSVFVDKLEKNLNSMNYWFGEIKTIFENADIPDFDKLPEDNAEKGKFAEDFKCFNVRLQSAKIQGFTWNELEYHFKHDKQETTVTLQLDEETYVKLLARYKDLHGLSVQCGGGMPFEIVGSIVDIATGKIDADYMNLHFKKYLKKLSDHEDTKAVLDELRKTFATLSIEEQKFANLLLHDVERGDLLPEEDKTFRDYLNEYMKNSKSAEIRKFAETFGIDEQALADLISQGADSGDINEFGRFDSLVANFDKAKAKAYFEAQEGKTLKQFEVTTKFKLLTRDFIIAGGFEI
ncbi:MAG: type I restriction endonuclease subunit R [Synergistaceae bacterium]|nr:type I restriction endonuclease subunit R [Candidatus Equadaptatus faecalis]